MAYQLNETRAIDRISAPTSPPSNEMKVLVLGAARSGTTSLGTALQMLGYRACIGVADSFNHDDKFPFWTEAIDAKYHGIGKPYSTSDMHKFLGRYEAVSGFGAALLADELIAAFPKALVICTERDPEQWAESYNETIVTTYLWWQRWTWILPFTRSIYGEFVRFKSAAVRAWCFGNERSREQQMRFLAEHNRRVRSLVPEGRLLVYRPGDGWEPLCAFLGQAVPRERFPHSASRAELQRYMALIWRRAVGRAVLHVGVVIASVFMGLRGWRGVYSYVLKRH